MVAKFQAVTNPHLGLFEKSVPRERMLC